MPGTGLLPTPACFLRVSAATEGLQPQVCEVSTPYSRRLLLDSRGVDVPIAYHWTLVMLSLSLNFSRFVAG